MQKGPVIGPLVLCGVCSYQSNLKILSEIGVKDSKKLSPKRRYELAKMIKDICYSYEITMLTPQEIDERKNNKITLNELEVIKMAEIINKLKPNVIYVDAVDVNEKRFKQSIEKLLIFKPIKFISEHRADDIYPIVSAASIIAKDHRDMIIGEIRKKYGDFGSGYPSDKKTTDFIRKWVKRNKSLPQFVRKSWGTSKKIIDEELSNKKITDFID
jgi:ribonuclease HII